MGSKPVNTTTFASARTFFENPGRIADNYAHFSRESSRPPETSRLSMKTYQKSSNGNLFGCNILGGKSKMEIWIGSADRGGRSNDIDTHDGERDIVRTEDHLVSIG
jgi:hypothetical protein